MAYQSNTSSVGADAEYIWNATPISATNTTRSTVLVLGGDENVFVGENTTSTATGTLRLEGNILPDNEYYVAVAAAPGANWTLKEEANTTGWQQIDLLPDATIAITAGLANTIALLQPMPKRCRFVYTNATNSGVITATARKVRSYAAL